MTLTTHVLDAWTGGGEYGRGVSEAPVRLAALVFDRLKAVIIAGGYAPGTRLSIEELKAQFGVSKQPVMDAIRRLSTLGLVDIVPQSGCRIVEFEIHEAWDFFRLFASAEGEIAGAAARRRRPEDIAELENALIHLHELEAATDLTLRGHDYHALNRPFHLAIHVMARSRVMAELSERMWDLSDFMINTMAGPERLSGAISDRNRDHDLIRDAIVQGNDTVARAAMEHHIRTTARLFDDRHRTTKR